MTTTVLNFSKLNQASSSWFEILSLDAPMLPALKPNARKSEDSKVSLQGSSAFQEIERELRFFVPTNRLRELSSLPNLNVKMISQHNFPKHAFREIRAHLPKADAIALFDDVDVKRARIRHVHCGKQDIYFLQTKSAKRELLGHKIERDEPTLRIPAELYRQLLPKASDGSLVKLRMMAVGQVFGHEPEIGQIELHADILLAAGKQKSGEHPEVISPARLAGSVVEIEFGNTECLSNLLAGRHSFAPILEGCPLLTEQHKSLVKALRTSRIAKDGFDREAERAMRKLAA